MHVFPMALLTITT